MQRYNMYFDGAKLKGRSWRELLLLSSCVTRTAGAAVRWSPTSKTLLP